MNTRMTKKVMPPKVSVPQERGKILKIYHGRQLPSAERPPCTGVHQTPEYLKQGEDCYWGNIISQNGNNSSSDGNETHT